MTSQQIKFDLYTVKTRYHPRNPLMNNETFDRVECLFDQRTKQFRSPKWIHWTRSGLEEMLGGRFE